MGSDNTRQEALALAKRLRHHSMLKNRPGILDGKRVDFFKAKHAFRILQSTTFDSANTMDASAAFSLLIRHKFIRRVDKLSSRAERTEHGANMRRRTRRLRISAEHGVTDKAYYVWLYDQIPITTVLLGIAALLLVLAVIVYPLWPPRLRRVAHRLSWVALGLVVSLLILTVLRLFIFIITLAICPPGIWLFPNLYEDVGFIDSFRPLWGWHVKRKSKRKTAKNIDGKGSGNGSCAVSTSTSNECRPNQVLIEDVDEKN
ncbi:Sec63 complex subunit SEC62 [Pneumocystis jirovecii RU7]|uniref:Translocation protein SEC62 n=1 Tax=Pneumocystis jirovecii (strain RU7) TaxID=1408657 RepID=A0A0W4ZFP5_PNEJ7|nr:Sec63 complex subunit SEC62 [Pneumocystis jirovecii RU7]KTW27177.1 hypothetical protein T551_03171 [Pneumocystis jirovecii RU7]